MSPTRRSPTLVQRCVAEGLGTFVLVFIGSGAAMLSTLLPRTRHFPATAAELLLVAFGLGFALFISVMMFGRISGAHVNPAVTVGLAATSNFAWADVLPYVVAQIVGAIVGALGIAVIYGRLASTVGRLGAPALSSTTSVWQGLLAEAVGAAILMTAVFATAIDVRAPSGWAGLVIGLSLAAGVLFLGPATGGSLNPARALGPDLVDVFLGTSVNWVDFLVCYTIGPLLGMTGAALLYRYLANLVQPDQSAIASSAGRRSRPAATAEDNLEPGAGATT